MRRFIVLAALLLPLPALAVPVTVNFAVNGGASGPLAGLFSLGSFSFDRDLFPPAGGGINQAGLFSSLDFTWNGIHYDASTANTGSLAVLTDGLVVATFGTNCGNGPCFVSLGEPNSWFILANSRGDPGLFSYNASGRNYVGNVLMGIAPTRVPEPGMLALMATALGLLALRARLRKDG